MRGRWRCRALRYNNFRSMRGRKLLNGGCSRRNRCRGLDDSWPLNRALRLLGRVVRPGCRRHRRLDDHCPGGRRNHYNRTCSCYARRRFGDYGSSGWTRSDRRSRSRRCNNRRGRPRLRNYFARLGTSWCRRDSCCGRRDRGCGRRLNRLRYRCSASRSMALSSVLFFLLLGS
jgi:hypothetical protein